MKKILLLTISHLIIRIGFTQNSVDIKYGQELDSYVEFLKKQSQSPVDYIMNLFQKDDIVILGERDHRDTTQYDLILKLIGDNRFIENVGNVFLEVGTINQSPKLNALLKQDIADSIFRKELIKILREIEFYPLWEKFNYYQFMTGIYEINKKLPDKQKINIFLTDVAFSWEGMTEEKYRDFITKLSVNNGMGRDSIMAFNFINKFDEILTSNSDRKKALVIYNGPHSYGKFDCYGKDEYINCAGKYIIEKYPNKVANVMINWTKYAVHSVVNEPVVEGKWDAAFRVIGNPNVGFDFANSLFGNDLFDHYYKTDIPCSYAKYKDVYTGFIFYLPIEKWVCATGTPDIVDDTFAEELVRRHEVIGKKNLLAEALKQYYNMIESFPCYKTDEIEKHINKWLK